MIVFRFSMQGYATTSTATCKYYKCTTMSNNAQWEHNKAMQKFPRQFRNRINDIFEIKIHTTLHTLHLYNNYHAYSESKFCITLFMCTDRTSHSLLDPSGQ